MLDLALGVAVGEVGVVLEGRSSRWRVGLVVLGLPGETDPGLVLLEFLDVRKAAQFQFQF